MATSPVLPSLSGIQAKDRTGDDIQQFINSFVTQAHRVRQPYEDQWQENWSNYRVEPFTTRRSDQMKMDPYSGAYNPGILALKTPESHQIANTLVAVILASLFGVRDYVQASPTGDEDIDKAKLVSRLVMWGLERPGNFRTNYDALKDAVIFGTGVYRAGWMSKTRTVPRRIPVMSNGAPILDPMTGRPVTIMQNVEALVEDDFKLYPVNLWKIWFDPAQPRLPDMDGVVEMFTISKRELAMLSGSPAWRQDGIAEVLSGQAYSASVSSPGNVSGRPKLMTENLTDDDLRHVKEFGYCGGWRYSGRLPEELAVAAGLDPGMTAQVAVIGNALVQAVQVPQRDGEIPYGTITLLPNAETVYGLSPLTITRYLQDVSDTQLILAVQAMIESVYQNYLVGNNGAGTGPGFKMALQNRKAREVFTVPGDVSQVVPLPKDYQGLNIAMNGLALLSQTMRDASNARDPVQGVQSSDRSTATEVSTVAAAAMQNVDQISVLIERDELPRQGDLCYGAYYVQLDAPKIIQRIGDDAPTTVDFFDIDGEYDIKFTGARQALSKATKANQMRDFGQLMMSNPIGQASFDFLKFATMYQDEALDVRGLDQCIITDQNEVLARLQAAGVGGPIQGGGGGTSDAMAAQDAGEANVV